MQPVIQNISSIASAINVVILAVGYYFMVKLYREWIVQSKEERTAGGRPMVVVAAGYDNPPGVALVVQNFNAAPAKDVTFEFSAPVEDSDGYVLSDLPYLKEGMPFLAPEQRITCYWDTLPALIDRMKEKGLGSGIAVTTRYKDLAGKSYETEWRLNPLLFDGARIGSSRGMDDLVGAVSELSEDGNGEGSRGPTSGAKARRGAG